MQTNITNAFKSFTRLQQFFLVLVAYFIGYWIFQCLNLIYYPIPTEYRDWGSIDLSNAFLNHASPYSFSLGPPFFYIYGLVFPLLAACFGWMLHIDLLLASKLLVCGCIILTACIVASEIHQLSGQRFPAILGFAATLWTGSATNAAFILNPASCGLLISLFALSQIRKSQSISSILIAALGTVLAFYTKQYFVYICAPIFLFLITNSGLKNALAYGLFFLGILLVSILLISHFYPAYFYATVLAQFYAVGGGWGHARSQFILFFNQYWPFIILLFIYLFGRIKKSTPFNRGENLYLFVLLIATICLIPLGRNTGSFLSYYYQLALPALMIIGLVSLSRLKSSPAVTFFTTGVFIFSIFHGELLSYRPIYSQQSLQQWAIADMIIADTSGPKLVSSPILAPIMRDALLLDNGHTECYIGLDTTSPLLDFLFPERHTYFGTFQQYFSDIGNQIAHKKFSLIAVTKDFHPMIPQSLLEANYTKFDTVALQTGGQTWATEFWIPKK